MSTTLSNVVVSDYDLSQNQEDSPKIDFFLKPYLKDIIPEFTEIEKILEKSQDPIIEQEPIEQPNIDIILQEKKKETALVLQKWEGVVEEIFDDYFSARLFDLTNKNNTEELAEFYFSEVSEADKPLVCRGAIFYWNLSYNKKVGGQLERSSLIRFRRLPIWGEDELDKSKNKVNAIHGTITWE